ncbi:hydroxypyruvate isomerase family protein [Fulvimarina endophytica]|nr:TIM barrel protein [Fulvimarina endophytica]
MTESFAYSAHIGYLFTELPFEKRIRAARDAGFSAVEFPAPYGTPAPDMARLLADAELPYVQFGLRSGDASKGEKGIGLFPDRRAEFRANLAEALDYAETIGVKMLHAMAGVLPEGRRRPEHRACYIENLALAAEEAEKRGIRIIVEAMSPAAVPDYYLPTLAAAREAIDEAGHRNLGLLLDVFHTVSVGDDPVALINAEHGRIAHVHIADVPGRHEPGSGSIDFASVKAALRKNGYRSFIGCEYVPEHTTSEGLGWMSGTSA